MNSENRPVINMIPERESLGFLLADTTRLIRRVYARHLDEHKMTVAQMRALVYLARNQGLRQIDLADILEVQPITLARLIDQLAEAGWVERRADPSDRRAFQLYLTAAAAPLIEEISQRSASFQKQVLEGLTAVQVESLFAGLNRVRDNLVTLLR
ncbi:MAG TPA: MarR family transcriptional regulator [Cellvibrio sp.]|nr:MarR family transcriptional regulator [Cellvibrio sp.]